MTPLILLTARRRRPCTVLALLLQTAQSLSYPMQLLRKRIEGLRKNVERLNAQAMAGEDG